jgi:hypothetical protein
MVWRPWRGGTEIPINLLGCVKLETAIPSETITNYHSLIIPDPLLMFFNVLHAFDL